MCEMETVDRDKADIDDSLKGRNEGSNEKSVPELKKEDCTDTAKRKNTLENYITVIQEVNNSIYALQKKK